MENKAARQLANRWRRFAQAGLALAFAVSALMITYRLGAAKELVSVRISGPGISGELEFSDAETLRLVQGLETHAFLVEEPGGLSHLVFEIRMGVGDGNDVFAYNVYQYSPPIDGSPGFLYFADVINGWSSAEGTWFPLSMESDRTLRKFLASHGGAVAMTGITPDLGSGPVLRVSVSERQPLAGLLSSPATWLIGGLAACAALFGMASRRRRTAEGNVG